MAMVSRFLTMFIMLALVIVGFIYLFSLAYEELTQVGVKIIFDQLWNGVKP